MTQAKGPGTDRQVLGAPRGHAASVAGLAWPSRALAKRSGGAAHASLLARRSFSSVGPRAVTVLLCAIVTAQLATLIGYGVATASSFEVWAPIDEAAHFSYVQYVADHDALPVMGRTYVSREVFALTARQQPAFSHYDVRHAGLGGLSYEAFQPPLYYLAASRVYDLAGGGLLDHVNAVRLFDVALLALAAVLALRLARVAAGRYWLPAWSVALVVLMMPGVVVRSVTVSNQALEMPLAILFATELLVAWRRHCVLRLLLAGLLLGLCLLTQTLLVALLPAFLAIVGAELWRRRSLAGAAACAAALLLPAVVVAPWIAFNESHYGSLTDASYAASVQEQAVNPHHVHYQAGALPGQIADAVLAPVLPEEWYLYTAGDPVVGDETIVLLALLFGGATLAAAARPRLLVSAEAAVLGLPFVATIGLLCAITVLGQWNVMLARYTYATLPLWAIFGATAAGRALRHRAPLAAASALGTSLMVVVWMGASGTWLP
jgi:hypothetical protein